MIQSVFDFMKKHNQPRGERKLIHDYNKEMLVRAEARAYALNESLDYGQSTLEDRIKLITEELHELIEAVCNNDEEEVYDAIIDLLYVIIGAGISFGFDIEKGFVAVHEHNMTKEVGTFKPKPGTKPDLNV